MTECRNPQDFFIEWAAGLDWDTIAADLDRQRQDKPE